MAQPCLVLGVLPLSGVLAVTITELIQLANNRLAHLAINRNLAVDRGDAAELAFIEAEIAVTQETLAKLQAI